MFSLNNLSIYVFKGKWKNTEIKKKPHKEEKEDFNEDNEKIYEDLSDDDMW